MLSHMHVNERRCNYHKLNDGPVEAVIKAIVRNFCLDQHIARHWQAVLVTKHTLTLKIGYRYFSWSVILAQSSVYKR